LPRSVTIIFRLLRLWWIFNRRQLVSTARQVLTFLAIWGFAPLFAIIATAMNFEYIAVVSACPSGKKPRRPDRRLWKTVFHPAPLSRRRSTRSLPTRSVS
jgi:hypothetical protein